MIVIADSNEQATSKRTIRELKRAFGTIMVSSLQGKGDLNVILDNGAVLAFERKEVHDFLASIADGRAKKQVEAMASDSKIKVYSIIIEGSLQINYDTDMVIASGEITKWNGARVRTHLFDIQASACPVMFTPQGTYADLAKEIVDHIERRGFEQFQQRNLRTTSFPDGDLRQGILMSFPDVGFVRSESLLNFYKDKDGNKPCLAEALAFASTMKFIGAAPKGWGKARIDSFREVLGLKDNEYLEIKKWNSED